MNDQDHDRSDEMRDDVASLIRLAGPRRPVPREALARARAAAHAHWRGEVRARVRRRLVWGLPALAAAASLALILWPRSAPLPTGPPAPFGLAVAGVRGPAWLEPADAGAPRRPVRPGDQVAIGATLATEPAGRVVLQRASGGSIRLDARTRLRVIGPGRVALDRGALYVDSGRRSGASGDSPLLVQTHLGVLEEIGTQFEARIADGSLLVRVREGLVRLDHDGRFHDVPVATQLTLQEDGSVALDPIAIHGQDWSWTEDLASVPDLAGLTAGAFLEWVARERGWRLSYASEDLARSAGRIVLGGSVERLTLEESLDAVLPTCGLAYRVDRGDLIVEPQPAAAPGSR